MRTTNPFRPHPDATALTAYRVIKNGYGIRAYTVAEPEAGRQAIERILRMARAVGYVTEADGAEYAVLSVLDDDDSELQEFGIPNVNAFRWWYRKVGWRVAA